MLNIRFKKVAVCGAVLLGAQVLVAQPATAAGDGFNGSWTSIDTDGSNQVLRITGAGADHRAAQLYDDAASVCGGVPALVSGTAMVDGTFLLLQAPVTCLPGGNPFRGRIGVEFNYDAGSDTLVDGSGVVWQRA